MKKIDEIVISSKDKLKMCALSDYDLMQHIQEELLGETPGYKCRSFYLRDFKNNVLSEIEPNVTFGFSGVYYSVNGSKFTPEQNADVALRERFDAHVNTYLEQEVSGLPLSEQEFRDLVFDFVISQYSSEPISARMHHAERVYEDNVDAYVN